MPIPVDMPKIWRPSSVDLKNLKNYLSRNVVKQYGQIWRYFAIWPKFKIIWQYLRVYLVLGTILKVLLQILYAFGLIFIVVNSHKMKK